MDEIFKFIALYIFSSLIAIAIAAYIFRVVFDFSIILKNNKAQTKLLAEIAAKNGVETEKITAIIKEVED